MLKADSLLDDIKQARQEAQRAEQRAKERERNAQVIETDLRYQLANIEEARRAVIAEARETAQSELTNVRDDIEQVRRQISRGGTLTGASTHQEFLARAEQEITRRQRGSAEVDRNVIVPGADGETTLTGPIEVGDRVWVANLQASGEVLKPKCAYRRSRCPVGQFPTEATA